MFVHRQHFLEMSQVFSLASPHTSGVCALLSGRCAVGKSWHLPNLRVWCAKIVFLFYGSPQTFRAGAYSEVRAVATFNGIDNPTSLPHLLIAQHSSA